MATRRARRSRRHLGHAAARASSSASRSSTGPAGSGPTSATFAALIGRLEGDLLDQIVPPGGGPRQGVDGARQPLGHDPPARAPAGLHGPARPRPVRPRAALGGDRARPAPVRRGEHPPHRAGARTCRSDPFRTWIALHETTHAFEFEAHPWLRPYLAERLERQLGAVLASDVASLGPGRRRGRSGARCAARRRTEHWMERLMSDEQRRAVPRDAGRDEPPRGVRRPRHGRGRAGPRAGRRATISARFHARRAQRTPHRAGDPADHRHGPQDGAVPQGRGSSWPRSSGSAGAGRRCAGSGTAPRRCRRDEEIERPERVGPAGHRDVDRGATDGTGVTGRPPSRTPGHRVAAPGGVPRGDRPHADPVRPLPGRGPRRDPGRGARVRASSRSVSRGPGRRPARRRRGPAARLARRRCVRAAPGPGARPALGPLGDGRRGAPPHAGRPRPRPHHHQRPRRLQPADRRVRDDDDPRREPAPAPAPGAPGGAHLAAARGRASCATSTVGHRRPREHRPGRRGARGGVRAAVVATRRARGGAARRGEAGRSSAVMLDSGRPRSACRSCSPRPTSSSSPLPLTPETEDLIDDEALARMKRRRLADQRRPRRAVDERALAPGAPRRAPRRRGPGHVPRGAAAARLAVLRPAERDRDAPHLLVERPGAGPDRRPLLRQPAALRAAGRCHAWLERGY